MTANQRAPFAQWVIILGATLFRFATSGLGAALVFAMIGAVVFVAFETISPSSH